ncbi:MAG: hypothetical protein RMK52_03630 [Chitinophagales bacterium]|nr:hypothetical protein [Chitinophagales bacterium]MDW8393318.1 hypothetical protein [Chitinophagales bacterium]
MRTWCLWIGLGLMASTAAAQQHTSALRESLLKQWAYTGWEEFGVFTPADSLRRADRLLLQPDGSFHQVWQGKERKGTFRFHEATRQLSLTDASTQSTVNFGVKKVTDSTLVLEYQSPDLVRTRHRFIVVRQ